MIENNYTICGGCCLRVPCVGVEPEPHMCEIIGELKRSLNAALSDIQKSFENNLEVHKEFIRNYIAQHAAKYDDRIRGIHVRTEDTEKKVKQFKSTVKRVDDLEVMFKFANSCIDNSHTIDASKYLGLAPIAKLNACVSDELKGIVRIKELERALGLRNAECQAALNESNKLRAIVAELSKENETLREGLDAVDQLKKLMTPPDNEVFNGGCKL